MRESERVRERNKYISRGMRLLVCVQYMVFKYVTFIGMILFVIHSSLSLIYKNDLGFNLVCADRVYIYIILSNNIEPNVILITE